MGTARIEVLKVEHKQNQTRVMSFFWWTWKGKLRWAENLNVDVVVVDAADDNFTLSAYLMPWPFGVNE